eukprot:GHVU01028488.1.p2 GENE.GHVU01028488.1~~GHVU01028488.1.p2  ORF type:complete len:113 (-),score=2.24 GHVU01028488.1:59-397(-)
MHACMHAEEECFMSLSSPTLDNNEGVEGAGRNDFVSELRRTFDVVGQVSGSPLPARRWSVATACVPVQIWTTHQKNSTYVSNEYGRPHSHATQSHQLEWPGFDHKHTCARTM